MGSLRFLLAAVSLLLVLVLAACTSAAAPSAEPGKGTSASVVTQEPPLDESPEGQPALSPTVIVTDNPDLGPILTDVRGMTLYRFTVDDRNVSQCYDQCAENWPPLLIQEGDPVAPMDLEGTLDVITRNDGTQQVTYNGMPLYYFARDAEPGDTMGHGVNDVWFVVMPGETEM